MMHSIEPTAKTENRAIPAYAPALRKLGIEGLKRHRLLAFAVSRGCISPEESVAATEKLLENTRRQVIAQKLLATLGDDVGDTAIGILKGAALWEFLYRAGEREAADIDLFVSERDRARLILSLTKLGFDRFKTERSPMASFKTVCLGASHGDLSIEIHTKLWWLEPKEFRWTWMPAKQTPFFRLSPEDQFIHLSGHWISQHTMLSLHWLFDLVLFLERHGAELDWACIESRARTLRLLKAVRFARQIANDVGSPRGFQNQSDRQIDFRFLSDPTGSRAKYYWFKHRVQDSWTDALLYDWHWLINRLRTAAEDE